MSNHIKFGDKTYQVSYIQSFLRDNYSRNVLPTNIYDKQTHEALIKYLNQPNVEDMSIVEKNIEEQYNELSTLFRVKEEDDSVLYIGKIINQQTSDFISLFIIITSPFERIVHNYRILIKLQNFNFIQI